jgi:hypothetical protein
VSSVDDGAILILSGQERCIRTYCLLEKRKEIQANDDCGV